MQAAGQGMLDIWQFFLARLVQHEIGHLLGEAEGARVAVRSGGRIAVRNETLGAEIAARLDLAGRARRVLLAGGLLNDIKGRV